MLLTVPPIDEIDTRLLDLLQNDADQTLRQLGDQVGLSPSAVQRRIKRYKSSGLLRTVAVIDPRLVASLTQAIVLLALVEESPDHHGRLTERLRSHPAVQQCYLLSGRWDYAVLVSVGTVQDLRELSHQLFRTDENIRRYDTMFVLDTVKSGSSLPVDAITRGL